MSLDALVDVSRSIHPSTFIYAAKKKHGPANYHPYCCHCCHCCHCSCYCSNYCLPQSISSSDPPQLTIERRTCGSLRSISADCARRNTASHATSISLVSRWQVVFRVRLQINSPPVTQHTTAAVVEY